MNHIITRSLAALVVLVAACACTEKKTEPEKPGLLTPSELRYGAYCTTDTIRFTMTGGWTVETDADWITLPLNNRADGVLPVYIQENGDDAGRIGHVIIRYGDGELIVRILQHSLDDGAADVPNVFKTGLGYGFDVKIDYADVSGIRGQIFDEQALKNFCGTEDITIYEPNTMTRLDYKSGESAEVLQKEIAGKVGVGVDVKVASVRVESEYSKQITEQKERWYVWCRDFRSVTTAYFANEVDIYWDELLRECTTSSFRKSVKEDTPKEIVRKYGTHLVTEALLGGKLDYYFTVATDITTEVEKIITTINVRVLFFSTSSTAVDEKTWTDIKRNFDGSFKVTGGGEIGRYLNEQMRKYTAKGEPLTDKTLFDRWYACFKDHGTVPMSDLSLVDFSIVPIWQIIGEMDEAKGEEVEKYILRQYLK